MRSDDAAGPTKYPPPLQSLLVEAEQAGTFYLNAGDLAPLQAAARGLGFRSLTLDLEGCRDADELLRRFARTLSFPAFLGTHWNALADCLSDLDWLPADGYVLGIRHAEELRENNAADYAALLAVLELAGDHWRERGLPFWSFIALPGPTFAAMPA